MISELEKLAKAATPGPWKVSDDTWVGDPENALTVMQEGENSTFIGDGVLDPKDARYIAAANPEAILKLIAVVRVAKHALEIGYFSEGGSTENWMREALAALGEEGF